MNNLDVPPRVARLEVRADRADETLRALADASSRHGERIEALDGRMVEAREDAAASQRSLMRRMDHISAIGFAVLLAVLTALSELTIVLITNR